MALTRSVSHWLVGKCLRNSISSDFRTLAHICLSRGEVVAPRILIRELSQHQGLQSDVIVYYVVQCVNQGQDIVHVIRDLRTDVDLKQFPTVG